MHDVPVDTCTVTHAWRSEDSFVDLVLSSLLRGFWELNSARAVQRGTFFGPFLSFSCIYI